MPPPILLYLCGMFILLNSPFRISVFILALLLSSAIHAQVITIAAARNLGPGATVTVRGTVTNGAELGKIRYLQDATAGIAAYPGTGSAAGFEQNVTQGDLVEVTGVLTNYQGLLEITPITAYQVISSGNALPAPATLLLSELSEDYEGELVRVNCVAFSNAGSAFNGGGTYTVTDAYGNSAEVYFRTGHPMSGSTAPAASGNITTILSQYGGSYQLLPRTAADFSGGTCFFFTALPDQSNIATTSFKLNWSTSLPSSTRVQYGLSPDNLNLIDNSTGTDTEHTATLTDLAPGTVYWARAISISGDDTLRSEVMPYCTKSLSSGEIQVYFNYPINEDFVSSKQPSGTSPQECLDAIIHRINQAQQTIDVAIYNVNRDEIVTALVNAHLRGVTVRYVAAASTSNASLNPPPPFPVVLGNDNALMHNKFMIVDADITDKAWVMGGSMNWTTGNIFTDNNNMLLIQDQSLARGYRIEFEEMWGSNNATPVAANQRFGSAKRNNTPHKYQVDNVPVESWFSPSDGVTTQIVNTIATANASAEFALFSFTKNEPADALIQKHNEEGVLVRGIMDNINDVGSEYPFLLQQGIPVSQQMQPGELHHKYIVIDAMLSTSQPTVLTGSHNWSTNAETVNDENTLILRNSPIARLYRAEWEQRFAESPVTVRDLAAAGVNIYPNPASDYFMVRDPLHRLSEAFEVEVWNISGQMVLRCTAQSGHTIQLNTLPEGSYVVRIYSDEQFGAFPLQKI